MAIWQSISPSSSWCPGCRVCAVSRRRVASLVHIGRFGARCRRERALPANHREGLRSRNSWRCLWSLPSGMPFTSNARHSQPKREFEVDVDKTGLLRGPAFPVCSTANLTRRVGIARHQSSHSCRVSWPKSRPNTGSQQGQDDVTTPLATSPSVSATNEESVVKLWDRHVGGVLDEAVDNICDSEAGKKTDQIFPPTLVGVRHAVTRASK
jgi:hypothetical protein